MAYAIRMTLDQLSYFLEAARQEHLAKAAKILCISPSAISHSISALEEELGRELFVKQGKQLHLTPHGKLLAEQGKRLLAEAARIQEEVASDKVEMRGHYRIAATHGLASKMLTPAWADLQTKNNQITAEIYSLRSSQVVQGVISGEYDFGICFNPQEHPEIESQILQKGSLRICVNRSHPVLKLPRTQQYAQLSSYPAVLPKAFQGIEICERHPVFSQYGIQPQPDCLFDNYEVAIEKVIHSYSWGFFPDLFIPRHSQLQALQVPKGWDAPYRICAVWQKRQPLISLFRQLINLIKI